MKTNSLKLKITEKYRKTPKGVLTNMYQHMKLRHKVDFDLKTFHSLYLTDKKFLQLFNKWLRSGCLKSLKPSLDRIDNKKHYSLDNIQMMTWAKNREKQSKVDGKKGTSPPVLQILNGKVIRKFQCQRDVVNILGIHQGNLSQMLNGKYKYKNLQGYQFEYEIIGNIYENKEFLK